MTIDFAPHQIAGVERALTLLRERGGVILADDVGLGKSFIAAEVAARAGGLVEWIVPAGLVAQWTATLEAFGLDPRITTHDRIVNEPFVPQADGERLIVVDEAHAFRNPRTQRYAALARRSIAARLLLVTATPICNSPADLHALVSLIAADDALRAAGVASIDDAFRLRSGDIAIVMRELVIRRTRDVLTDPIRFGDLHRHVVQHDVIPAPIDALTFPLIGGHPSLLRSVLWRRLESSEAALLESVKRQIRFYHRALDCLASGHTLTKHDYVIAFRDEDADAFQEVLFWEVFAGDDASGNAEELRAELARLDALRVAVENAPQAKVRLLAKLCAEIREPILIFTAAIATAHHIAANIDRAGVVTSRGCAPVDALDAFRRGTLDVLVCTDLASEGLNLQRAAAVVHYDIPWNPVKMDQRNGRALRIGQHRDVVQAIYFVPRGRRTRVVQAVASKNRLRRWMDRRQPGDGLQPIHTLDSLPQHLPRNTAVVNLLDALRRRGVQPPRGITRRYRAGIERLFAEMATEYLDLARVSDLTLLLERERIIGHGAPIGPSDR